MKISILDLQNEKLNFGQYKGKYTWGEVYKWDFSYINWMITKTDIIVYQLDQLYTQCGPPLGVSILISDERLEPGPISDEPFNPVILELINEKGYGTVFTADSDKQYLTGMCIMERIESGEVDSKCLSMIDIEGYLQKNKSHNITKLYCDNDYAADYIDDRDPDQAFIDDVLDGDPDNYWNID